MWASAAVLVAGGVAFLVAHLGNTGRSLETPLSNEPAQVYHQPKTVRLTPAARVDAFLTASKFIQTAVLRKHLDTAWKLTAPSLKQGYTLREWETGDIPVVPYPAVGLGGWKVDYSYGNKLGLEVVLVPKAGSRLGPKLFAIELQRAGSGKHRHWLVDSWAPRGVSMPTSLASGSSSLAPYKARLGASWLLAPLALLALGLLTAAALGARGWYRGVRAARAYRSRSTLP